MPIEVARPVSDSQKYFLRATRPFGDLWRILSQSSAKPTAPNDIVTNSANQMKRFDRSPHSRVAMAMAPRIMAPPMVGVPVLARWLCGPSRRITWPNLSTCRRRMMPGPNTKQKISAVRMPRMARTDR